MEPSLAVLPGDGVGPAVRTRAPNVVQAVGEKFGQRLNFNEVLTDGVAIGTLGRALSCETLSVVVKYAKAGLERRRTSSVPGPDLRGE